MDGSKYQEYDQQISEAIKVKVVLMFCYRYPNQILSLGQIHAESLALLSKKLAGESLVPPVNDAAESNLASNFLPNQLELPF